MIDAMNNLSTPVGVGLILFDETRSRVFAVRGAVIEDAREFAAEAGISTIRLRRSAFPPRMPAAEQFHDRAMLTALLVAELHACCPFDCLLVAGPFWARALLWQHLPPALRLRLAGSVDLDIGAGESAILNVVLPAVDVLVRKSALAAQRTMTTARHSSWSSRTGRNLRLHSAAPS